MDIKNEIQESGGNLTDSWRGRTYEFEGDLLGEVINGGSRAAVSGRDVRVNMMVFAKEKRQIVEVQFFDNVLLGLSTIFKKG